MAAQHEQGRVGGATRKKASGSHLDQGPTGASKQRSTVAQTGGKTPPNVPGNKGITGSHLTPHPTLTNKTAERGGGGLKGHDRTPPNAGKANSGSKNDQNPNVKAKGPGPSMNYLKG